ncbi:MAG: TRAP transporter small permease subunit [Acetobacteraceae bacterium]|nr:TRAP transporter small permease subunit [Acetobacteraceae bacterium]MDW8399442.1 TRAP transporter small permease subunit [Acetobacteraceae bacterium]
MGPLLAFSRAVDAMNRGFGRIAEWCVLAACLVAAGNAFVRYGFSFTSGASVEAQWYLFAAVVLLGASETLQRNGHVRVDLVYGSLRERARLWIDVFGLVFFLLPAMALLAVMCWPFFVESWTRNEISPSPGGLLRWPVKFLLPLGFALVALQGVSELVKRIALLRGLSPEAEVVTSYERPLQ